MIGEREWYVVRSKPRREEYAQDQLLRRGVETFLPRIIEPLRGLRMAHYAAWLARRWHDPIFPKNWPHFGTEESWERETIDLEEQSIVVARVERGGTAAEPAAAADEEALTNKDLFWDWDG